MSFLRTRMIGCSSVAFYPSTFTSRLSLTTDVEEICDQANEEEKDGEHHPRGSTRCSLVVHRVLRDCLPRHTDISPLLGIGEEDFEALENDQLTVQGMI
jgi:hypothetical protein